MRYFKDYEIVKRKDFYNVRKISTGKFVLPIWLSEVYIARQSTDGRAFAIIANGYKKPDISLRIFDMNGNSKIQTDYKGSAISFKTFTNYNLNRIFFENGDKYFVYDNGIYNCRNYAYLGKANGENYVFEDLYPRDKEWIRPMEYIHFQEGFGKFRRIHGFIVFSPYKQIHYSNNDISFGHRYKLKDCIIATEDGHISGIVATTQKNETKLYDVCGEPCSKFAPKEKVKYDTKKKLFGLKQKIIAEKVDRPYITTPPTLPCDISVYHGAGAYCNKDELGV